MDDIRLGIGGNHPPFTALDVSRYLAEVEQPRLMRRDDLLGGVARFKVEHAVINDADTQGRAGDFAKQLQAAISQNRDAFTHHKKPFLEGGRAVDQFFKALNDPLERGLADVRAPMTAYALRLEEAERRRLQEEARNAREEAARLQRELAEQERLRAEDAAKHQREVAERELAGRKPPPSPPPLPPAVTIEETISAADEAERSAKAAAAKAADLTRNRGDLGSVSSLRELWDVEVIDITKVPPDFLLFDYARARRAITGGKLREIPGCRVFVTKHIMTR